MNEAELQKIIADFFMKQMKNSIENTRNLEFSTALKLIRENL